MSYWTRAAAAWNDLTDFLIADPETTRLDRAYDDRGRGRDDYDYLSESDPAANVARFVGNVLGAQRSAGATVLVTPWLLHGMTQTEHELAATIRFAEAAVEAVGDEELLVGVEATEGVFATAEARNALINELVEGPELPVYLRMRITAPSGYKQYQQRDGLEGLREVVRALEANDRPVILPQSGLTGWLMTAFGARSFGAGMAASLQRNTMPSSGGGGLPPLHWYYVPELLGFVQAEEMPDIAGVAGFNVCTCPYCDGDLPEIGAKFDLELAGKHFLWRCAQLAAELPEVNPGGHVSRLVSDASDFWTAVQEAGVSLDARSQATHLAVWSTVLDG
jgi:hypothetical protein